MNSTEGSGQLPDYNTTSLLMRMPVWVRKLYFYFSNPANQMKFTFRTILFSLVMWQSYSNPNVGIGLICLYFFVRMELQKVELEIQKVSGLWTAQALTDLAMGGTVNLGVASTNEEVEVGTGDETCH